MSVVFRISWETTSDLQCCMHVGSYTGIMRECDRNKSQCNESPYHVECDPATSISEDLCIPNLQVKHPLGVHAASDATLSSEKDLYFRMRLQAWLDTGREAHYNYRESMHVMIASLALAPKGNGLLKLLCHRDAACIKPATSAMLLFSCMAKRTSTLVYAVTLRGSFSQDRSWAYLHCLSSY